MTGKVISLLKQAKNCNEENLIFFLVFLTRLFFDNSLFMSFPNLIFLINYLQKISTKQNFSYPYFLLIKVPGKIRKLTKLIFQFVQFLPLILNVHFMKLLVRKIFRLTYFCNLSQKKEFIKLDRNSHEP